MLYFFVKSSGFSVLTTPSHAKWPFFFENNVFFASSEINEVADLRQGSSFLTFFTFFLLKLGSCIFALQALFGGLIFGVVTVLGRSSGLF